MLMTSHHVSVRTVDLPQKADRISLETYDRPPNATIQSKMTDPDRILIAKSEPIDPYCDVDLQNLDKTCGEIEKDNTSTPADGLLGDQDKTHEFAPHPLFPSLPSYGPPSLLFNLQCLLSRCLSFILSLLFLSVIVVGAIFGIVKAAVFNMTGQQSTPRRYASEERTRELERRRSAQEWKKRQKKKDVETNEEAPDECPPLEGGKDPIVCDVGYYARRIGLDVETFNVQTEDGFVITLWHVYNPQEYTALSTEERRHRGPHAFSGQGKRKSFPQSNRRYPVLLVHGLLQSAGAYCTNDDDSFAFFLCKSGYDVWLGNNRCGLHPQHTSLSTSDPRMWSWDIRHLGVLDLAALVSRVLYETGFEKLGLVCHSQGTTQTLVALAKDQRPELGERISVFCALAPAAYAGPLIERNYFRFMRNVPPSVFRAIFGIHAFIPFMMTMHRVLHPRIYGTLGYYVFAYLFRWSDTRWDRGLRDRMFQFAPVYISSEMMRWWLGQGGFATQKCILSTLETTLREEEEDRQIQSGEGVSSRSDASAWYGPQVPPFAMWIAGSDELVDGRQLLRRFESGREPHVRLVHAKLIEEYEHLDVLWAMDAVEQVGKEVREVLWRTMPDDAQAVCRVPAGVVNMRHER